MKIQLDTEGYQPRRSGLFILQCFVAGFFVLFVLRFWFLQIHKGEEYARQALDNRLRQERIFATRGVIRDRNGLLLAENRTAFGLTLVREDCKDIPATLAQVSEWTGMPLERLQAKYNQDRVKAKPYEPLLLLSDLPFDAVARIESRLMFWPGLQIVTRSKRAYPYGSTFAHILGYVAEASGPELENDKYLSLGDAIGKQGVEFVLEEQLRGRKGLYSVDVDVLGRVLGKNLEETPQHGEHINLYLDATLQSAIAEILGDQTGSVVVMDPDTGQILALVTTPAYDNNMFIGGLSQKNWDELRNNPKHPLQNRGVQSVYPPGSIWKLMMAGLILESGISPKQKVQCTGEVTLGKQAFRCWRKGGHGHVDLENALIESCDVYFYTMGEKLGIDRMESFAKACGFGSLTGIDLPYEKSGLVPSRAWKRLRHGERWQRGETLHASIGQGYILTTPMQIARFIAALTNGGKLVKPLLVSGEPAGEAVKLPMSDATRAYILNAMRETVEAPRGTAKVLRRANAVMGGKTGTAQVVKLRMSGERRLKTEEMTYYERDHAWMASWGERNGQKLVIVAMIEHGGGGSSVAGPIVRRVYDQIYGPDNANVAEKKQPQEGQTVH